MCWEIVKSHCKLFAYAAKIYKEINDVEDFKKFKMICLSCVDGQLSGYSSLIKKCKVMHFGNNNSGFQNIFDFTTGGDWDCVAAVERLPALHYSVDFIYLSFGFMGSLWNFETIRGLLMTPKRQKLASLAQEICTLWFQFFGAVFASKGYPFRNIFDFTTAGDCDLVAAVEHFPALHYIVDFIFLSFGFMGFIVEQMSPK